MPLTELSNSEKLGTTRAAHLLRRCTFNVTPKRIREFADLTAHEAVEKLFDFSLAEPDTEDQRNQPLLFPHGPLWYKDGAPMHPPGYGAKKVNWVGGRHSWQQQDHDPILSYSNCPIPPGNCIPEPDAELLGGGSVSFADGTDTLIKNVDGSVIVSKKDQLTATYLQASVYSWRMHEAINDTSIRWKLVFWINSLFTTAHEYIHYHYPHWKLMYDFVNGGDVTSGFVPHADRKSNNDLRSYANSLKALAFAMTYSNEMLLYLDNNTSIKEDSDPETNDGPNENYAREFLELFTILKAQQAGPADYTNYTEQDIVEAAKVLTGFKDEDKNFNGTANRIWGKKIFNDHDTSTKTFSYAFDETEEIVGATDSVDAIGVHDMDRELWDFIHMVFDQSNRLNNGNTIEGRNPIPTAYSFATRMYRYFVSDKIDSAVIEELANDLYTKDTDQDVNFLYIPVLKKLLKSTHFYADGLENSEGPCNSLIGSKLKSPLELLLTSVNLLEIKNEDLDNLVTTYHSHLYADDEDPEKLNSKGFITEEREPLKLFFDPINKLIDGPYPNDDSITPPNSNFSTTLIFAKKGNGHVDLVTLNEESSEEGLAENDLSNVFHKEVMDLFYVPLQLCGFDLKGPETVEGYRGYYKEENYSKNWLDSGNFYNRYVMGSMLVEGEITYTGGGGNYTTGKKLTSYVANLIKWVEDNIDYSNPTSPNPNPTGIDDVHHYANFGPATDADLLVSEMLKYFIAVPPENGSDRFNYFKDILLSGLDPFAWSVIWIRYKYSLVATELNEEEIENLFNEAEKPLKNLCNAIMQSHEFQTF